MTNEFDDTTDDPRLKALLDAAAALPREVDPPVNGWQGVASRIAARGTSPARRMPRAWWGLAAAAAIVIAVALPFRSKDASPPPVATAPVVRADSPIAPPVAPVQPVSLEKANPALARTVEQYRASARELESAISARSMSLPPATREAVKKSLADIDAAIADLVAALGAAPNDPALSGAITAIYEQKLDLLRRVRTASGASM